MTQMLQEAKGFLPALMVTQAITRQLCVLTLSDPSGWSSRYGHMFAAYCSYGLEQKAFSSSTWEGREASMRKPQPFP